MLNQNFCFLICIITFSTFCAACDSEPINVKEGDKIILSDEMTVQAPFHALTKCIAAKGSTLTVVNISKVDNIYVRYLPPSEKIQTNIHSCKENEKVVLRPHQVNHILAH